jgi:hypothetical protein
MVQGLGAASSLGSGVRVEGLTFRVQGLGIRVPSLGFKVKGSGFRVPGSGCRGCLQLHQLRSMVVFRV